MNVQYKLDSKIGSLYLTANDSGLSGIFWKKQNYALIKNPAENAFLKNAAEEISLYLDGKLKKFTVPLDFKGTIFQETVWKELMKIPFGKTISYKELAARIKNEKAIRAVGTANGRNPICIIIPCHRVIASDGTLGGYAGGLSIKEKLLQLETRQ